MFRFWSVALVAVSITGFLALTAVEPARAQVGVERQVLLQQDLAIPGYQVLLVEVTIAIGGREGRHTHPGTLVGRVLEGELTLEQAGLPTMVLTAGDSVLIDPGRLHEGINTGSVPVKALATFVVEKDKPLTTQVP